MSKKTLVFEQRVLISVDDNNVRSVNGVLELIEIGAYEIVDILDVKLSALDGDKLIDDNEDVNNSIYKRVH